MIKSIEILQAKREAAQESDEAQPIQDESKIDSS